MTRTLDGRFKTLGVFGWCQGLMPSCSPWASWSSSWHWTPKSHKILMFVCLQKVAKQSMMLQSLIVPIVLVNNQHSEYNQAFWHHRLFVSFRRQTNMKILRDQGSLFPDERPLGELSPSDPSGDHRSKWPRVATLSYHCRLWINDLGITWACHTLAIPCHPLAMPSKAMCFWQITCSVRPPCSLATSWN